MFQLFSTTYVKENIIFLTSKYTTKAVVEGNPIDLVLFDTAGDGDYDTIRPLNYPGSQCFLICFSVTQISSAEGVVKKWIEEVRGSIFTILRILNTLKQNVQILQS